MFDRFLLWLGNLLGGKVKPVQSKREIISNFLVFVITVSILAFCVGTIGTVWGITGMVLMAILVLLTLISAGIGLIVTLLYPMVSR